MCKRLLVLSPHADDAEIGCGGYISRVVGEGGEVLVVLATVGDIFFHHLQRIVTAEERLSEFESSMSALGVQHKRVLTQNLDSNLNTYPQGQMVAMLDTLHLEFKPTEVLLPLPSAHQDHRYCWEVGVAATRPSAVTHALDMVAAYEYPLTSWGDGSAANSFRGGVYVNITDHWNAKVTAIRAYGTQMREGNPIGLEALKALARMRGMEAGFEYAELFHALRIRIR